MAYDREELFNLSVAEKCNLVMDLWESIDDNFLAKELTKQGLGEEIDKELRELKRIRSY